MRQLIILFLSVNTFCHAQLENNFYGTYRDSSYRETYTVYSMDEVTSDCFLVEYERYSNFQLVQTTSGYGHCHGSHGHMEVKLRDMDTLLEIWFEDDSSSAPRMIIYRNGAVQKVLFKMDDLDDDGGFPSEPKSHLVVYQSENGRSLELSINPSDSMIAFVLRSEKCEKGGWPGTLFPQPGDVNKQIPDRYIYLVGGQCELFFTFSSDSILIEEKSCDYISPTGCPDWSGLYVLSP